MAKPSTCKSPDTRWTKKGGKSYFGYQDHICIDTEHGLIRRCAVSDASVHDSQVFGQLLDEDNDNDNDQLWADSAYRSEAIEEALALMGFDSQIHERAYRNAPLSEAQKQSNRTKSKTRAKVEHVFGRWVIKFIQHQPFGSSLISPFPSVIRPLLS